MRSKKIVSNWRRALGALSVLFPFGETIASIVWGQHHVPVLIRWVSLPVTVLAVFVASFNFYLSLIRPALFHRRPEYRHISGAPAIGTILVVVGIFLGFGDIFVGWLGFAELLLDTGGWYWFIIVVWREDSFWNS